MTHQKQVSEQFFTTPRRVACGGGVQRMGAASQLSPRPLTKRSLGPSQTAKTTKIVPRLVILKINVT